MEETLSPARILRAILIGVALFLAGAGLFVFIVSNPGFTVPHVVPDAGAPAGPPITIARSFPFQNGSVAITTSVNASLYASSKQTYRSTFQLGDPKVIGTRYYTAMINDPTQEPLYGELLGQFRQVRDERHLSDDEYLELMAAAVQTIPYRSGGNSPPKYPAELLADNMGDCDDKAILLAGLLARENYTVVLFEFVPESHMAMGVGSDAFPYKSTGYTYLEAMTPAYMGVPSSYVVAHRLMHSDPLVLPVSNGTRVYRGGAMTSAISNLSALAEQRAAALTLRLDQVPPGERSGTEYAAMLADRDRYAGINRYVLNHPLDRPGTYEYLQREMGT